MVHFEEYLKRCMRPEYEASYIQYGKIKALLHTFRTRRKQTMLNTTIVPSNNNNNENESIDTAAYGQLFEPEDEHTLVVARLERSEFLHVLQGQLLQAIAAYDSLKIQDSTTDKIEAAFFLVCNVLTFRQPLIRYDAYRRQVSHGLSLNEWDVLRSTQFNWDLQLDLLKDPSTREIMERLQHILYLTDAKVGRHIVSGILSHYKIFLFGMQSYGILFGIQAVHLKKELRQVCEFREETLGLSSSLSSSNPPDDDQSWSSRLSSIESTNVLPLFLNLLSCFLFMMNNYIIEPSSAYYANYLGGSDALSGIMIGAAAWFALISAVVYSFWTNYSYKVPLVFAGFLMVIGNVIYATAPNVSVCLLGRALTGLGAPRVINRRYLADATPFTLRTIVSASFAMVTALGAALGPGMAIVLDALPDFTIYGRLECNGMTAPGFFMAACWALYTVAMLVFFQEPVRSGLDELVQRETAMTAKQDPLLEEDKDDASVGSSDSLPIKKRGALLPRAVALCMSLIFMKRIALESIVGSTSVITKNRYEWNIQNVGLLHLINGIIVIPVSALAGWLSTKYEDRLMAVVFLSITLFGMMFMVDPTDFGVDENSLGYNEENSWSVGPIKYIIGSLIAFSGIEACESYVASLMSKVVPSSLAVGTFNSGLLATLVGTGGRAAGDLFITAMGLISIRQLLNLLIIPGAALVAISIALVGANYEVLGV